MDNDLFLRGVLHTAHWIFIRDERPIPDAELLMALGLAAYRSTRVVSGGQRHAVVANLGGWTMIADDLYYTLMNRRTTRAAVEWFARDHEVLTFWFGDADNAFSLAHYVGGRAIRRYSVEYPNFGPAKVLENFGEPFADETSIVSDPRPALLKIAASLGIIALAPTDSYRVWASVEEPEHDDD
jgi:hypothetical protein